MFEYQTYPFKKTPELNGEIIKIYDVIIVGGGPVGLTMALSLAKQGIQVVLLEGSNQIGVGSRAICFAKRSLEIFDKLGVVKPMLEKGVQWNVGRVFFREKEIDRFDLSPEKQSKYPAFINLQQYYVEQFLIDAVLKEDNVDVRFLNKVIDIQQLTSNLVQIEVETPEGNYVLKTKYLAACDGSRSTIRHLMQLEMHGARFEERFLIADFKMTADFPSERWFWFDPPFAKGQSILLHKQPDNLWRLDFKLGKTADASIAKDTDLIKEKIKCVVGTRPFELDWTSIYSFSSKKLDRFVHHNVLFVGDSAHVVSPFGARGANSGIQDADNLSWKLVEILKGGSPQLLETYNAERTAAAEQNIACTGETNTFIAPPSEAATVFRNDILEKAQTNPIYKRQINCGRLSVPNLYGKYPNSEEGIWKTADLEAGRAIKDCFLSEKDTNWTNFHEVSIEIRENSSNSCPVLNYLIEQLGYHFTLLTLQNSLSASDKSILEAHQITILEINAAEKHFINLYDLSENAAYLITPDQYILGRWKAFTTDKAINLMKIYLSGAVYDGATLQKSEQELIDEQIATKLKSL
jgi:3-(3-hydroxy-phenyl)propionate hydroxylase